MRLSCAAAALAIPALPVLAQSPGAAELDPAAPLEPMPDLGVEWPDLNAQERRTATASGCR